MINDPLLPSTRSTSRADSTWAPPVHEAVRVDASPAHGRASSSCASSSSASRTATASRSRRRHPAISSRILAVGLSTSAMFALTAGYASAERKSAPTPVDGVTPAQDGIVQQPAQDQTAQQNATAQQPVTGLVSPQQVSPQQATPRVVQVPVKPAAPATPAPRGSGGGNTQQSSGSN